jgi:hypothetical protein
MTSINPIFLYEIIKQKLAVRDGGWTPVNKISDFVESFNTSKNTTLILNGKGLTKGSIGECKNGLPSDKYTNLITGNNIKTIVINLLQPCLVKGPNGTELKLEVDLYGYDKKLLDLVPDGQSEETLLTDDKLAAALTKDKKVATIELGQMTPSDAKKDVISMLTTLLTTEYNKTPANLKDGNLKQQLFNEFGLLITDGQKYVEILDATALVDNQKLCDVSDSEINNVSSITNITKYKMLDEGKTFCVDVDMKSFFYQSKIQTINLLNGKSNANAPTQNKVANGNPMDGKGMLDSGKKVVLESYVAGILDQVYKDKNKYKVEILRPSDTVILIKITDNQTKELIFNKIDITNAVSDSGPCGEQKTDSRIKEYIKLLYSCKGSKFYKLAYNINGVDHTKITDKKISFAKLEESKDQKAFAEYIKILHTPSRLNASNKNVSNSSSNGPEPKSAYLYVGSPYGYGGVYGGLYGLGLYNAGLYGYPRCGALGCGTLGALGYGYGYGAYGAYGYGAYGYPYGYSGVYSLPSVYTPPLATTIVPTAPLITSTYVPSPVVATPPVVTAPIVSSVTPVTYNYPMVSTSNYTLGSYYSPYLGGYGYSYASPFQYTYVAPYTYVKSEEKRVKIDKDDVLPQEASSLTELTEMIKDLHPQAKFERAGSKMLKIEIEKSLIKDTFYYTYEQGKILLCNDHESELLI